MTKSKMGEGRVHLAYVSPSIVHHWKQLEQEFKQAGADTEDMEECGLHGLLRLLSYKTQGQQPKVDLTTVGCTRPYH